MNTLKELYENQVAQVSEKLNALKPRSAWGKGVIAYADMLLTRYKDELMVCEEPKSFDLDMALNGASDWLHFSQSAMGLAYPDAIRTTLLPPAKAKKREGKDGPCPGISWYEFEAQALKYAYMLLTDLFGEPQMAQKGEDITKAYLLNRASRCEAPIWVKWWQQNGYYPIDKYEYSGGAWTRAGRGAVSYSTANFLYVLHNNACIVANYEMIDNEQYNEL